jgi:hypothetical protein
VHLADELEVIVGGAAHNVQAVHVDREALSEFLNVVRLEADLGDQIV